MKIKSVLLAIAFGAVVFVAASAVAQIPGGASKVSVKDPEVVQAAKFACKAEEDAQKAKGEVQAIKLVEIVEAQRQIVQGASYTLTLQVKAGDHAKTAEAVVWVREWLKGDEKIKLTSWNFKEDK